MTRSPRVLVAALAVLAAPLALATAGEASAQGCGPAPAGQVAVAVVVDNGNDVSERCVIVAERTDGYEVLRAAGHQLRIEAGFLCGIDGFPATGCANQSGFDGAYWRYFHASPGGPWAYSPVGGGGYRMPPRCAIEGWRWSAAGSTAAAPRVAPPRMTCEAPPPTAAPTVPAPPAATTPPAAVAPGGAGGGAAGSAGAGGGATPTEPGGPASDAAPSTTVAPGDTPVEGDPSARPEGTSTTIDDDRDTGQDDPAASDDADGERAAAAGDPVGASGGSPVGLLLAGVVVVVLGAGAVWRNRRATSGAAGESVEGP